MLESQQCKSFIKAVALDEYEIVIAILLASNSEERLKLLQLQIGIGQQDPLPIIYDISIRGHAKLLDGIFKLLTPEQRDILVEPNTFVDASSVGCCAVVKTLWNALNDKKRAEIFADDNFGSIRKAILGSHQETYYYLSSICPDTKKEDAILALKSTFNNVSSKIVIPRDTSIVINDCINLIRMNAIENLGTEEDLCADLMLEVSNKIRKRFSEIANEYDDDHKDVITLAAAKVGRYINANHNTSDGLHSLVPFDPIRLTDCYSSEEWMIGKGLLTRTDAIEVANTIAEEFTKKIINKIQPETNVSPNPAPTEPEVNKIIRVQISLV